MEFEKQHLMIRIPQALNQKLKERVKKIGISKNAFVLNLVYQALNDSKDNNHFSNKENKN